MDINRIIDIIRTLKEEGMVVGTGGFSGSANPQGPVAGYDSVIGFSRRKKIIGKGTFPGARKRWRNGNVR